MTILPDLSLTALIFLAAVALVAGLVRGFSGFGAALIFTPKLSPAVITGRARHWQREGKGTQVAGLA